MSAREIMVFAIYREFENRPRYAQAQMNSIIADECAVAAVDALTAAGYRILAPGELDRETLERVAVLIGQDKLIDPSVRLDPKRHESLSDWFAEQRASAIRALAGKAGEA